MELATSSTKFYQTSSFVLISYWLTVNKNEALGFPNPHLKSVPLILPWVAFLLSEIFEEFIWLASFCLGFLFSLELKEK